MLVVISAAVVNQTTQTAADWEKEKMDWELACHELLNSLHHWFHLFRSLDPPAKPFFRLQRRFPQAKFSNIRFLNLDVSA